MAKTKKRRLTKNERLIREALTSQGRPLPGTPEDAAWVRGREYGEKCALEKASEQSPPYRDAVRKFSRDTALRWLDGIDEQFNNIASVAIGGLRYQETRTEEWKDPVTRGLLLVIRQQADDSTQASNELRTMLETLPKEANRG